LALSIHNGVYLAVQGPSYETPAEIYSFRTIGADLVGMSTVPEVIAARHSEIRVLGISCVTNMAAGTTDAPLNQEEVLEIAAASSRNSSACSAPLSRNFGGHSVSEYDHLIAAAGKPATMPTRPIPIFVSARPSCHVWQNLRRLQRGKRYLRPHRLRRTHRHLQSHQRRRTRFRRHRRRNRYRGAHFALRRLPPVTLGICGDIPVILSNLKGKVELIQMRNLFPKPFDASSL